MEASPVVAAVDAVDKPKKKNQPTMQAMVVAAISNAQDGTRKGVSSQAIKKHLQERYQVEFIRKNVSTRYREALAHAIAENIIVQVKGTGASGSFRMSKAQTAKPKKAVAKKPKEADSGAKPKVTKAKAAPVKKASTPAKPKATKSSAIEKKAVSPKVGKSPKAKKSPKKAVNKKKAAAAAK